MIRISKADILALEKLDRTKLVNSLSGYKSAVLIGTQNKEGLKNLAIFSSVVHIGANPPLMGIIQRPASVERHTYENIKATGVFTINQVPVSFYESAHQTSARYPRESSEFEACGFTPAYAANFNAPYVAESPLRIGLTLEEEIEIKSNQTILLIGSIQEVFIENQYAENENIPDLSKLNTLVVQGLDTYYKVEKMATLPYAKFAK